MSDNPNRIPSTSVTVTTPRQTPMNDFGQVMARTVSGAVSGAAQLGGAVAGAFIPGAPVVSAAVSGVANLAAGISGLASSQSGVTSVGGAPGTLGGPVGGGGVSGTGKGSDWDLMEAQKLMASEQRSFNMEYLKLQNAMQQESREFTALSNIMKVRHDSAKAAINNIR